MFFSKKFDPVTDIPNLEGKVAIVTGANAGIGFQTAQQLANHGATVYLAVRDVSKGNAAVQQIEKENPALSGKDRLKVLQLDLNSVKQTKRVALQFLELEDRLDLLVNNAGIVLSRWIETSDGIEAHMGVNHLGHFVLTTTVLPLLEKTASLASSDVRIVNLTSNVHSSAYNNVSYTDIDAWNSTFGADRGSKYAAFYRYGNSKLANILFTKELQRRFKARGVPILSIAVHPGGVQTEGANDFMRTMMPNFMVPLTKLFRITVLGGAVTSLFAATSPQVREQAEKYDGAYTVPFGKIEKPFHKANDVKLASTLWEASEKISSDILSR